MGGTLQTDYRFAARRIRPSPRITEPQVRQQVQVGCRRASVKSLDADTNIVRSRFGILDEHIEVPVIVEDSGVEQFVFRRADLSPAPAAFFQPLPLGKLPLRLLVE